MADVFGTGDARSLFKDKRVIFLGSSNMRATYKDMVLLMNRNETLNLSGLKMKGEESFEGDRRIVFSGLIKGRQYEEGREFTKFDTHLEYHFITRCYTPQIEKFFRKIKTREMKVPDVIIMNSCVWDINRWGPNGVDAYKENMHKLMKLLKECIPKETLFIWTTALPVSTQIKSALVIKQLDFMQSLLRFEVMEANLFCRRLVVSYGYDILDTHYHLRMQIHRRAPDGIHYTSLPVRFITNLILTHISLSWNVPLPGNITGIALKRVISNCVLQTASNENVQLPTVPVSLDDRKENNRRLKITPKKTRKYERNRGGYNNKGRAPPPWRDPPPVWQKEIQGWKNDDVWTGLRQKPSHPVRFQHAQPSNDYWGDSGQQEIGRNNYANFDLAPGPVRRTNKFPTGRHRPY